MLTKSSETKDIMTDNDIDTQSDPELSENLETLRINVKNVVQASTVMPFRWLVFAYRCFYCYDVFHHHDELKSHQTAHSDAEIADAMSKFWDAAVYIDVSVLNCKLCASTLSSVDGLIDHLMLKHKIPYNKDVVSFQSFKLGDKPSCMVCNLKFDSFGLLLTHTTSHHHRTEDRLCDTCGRTFKPHQIKMHLANEHRSKTVKCKVCKKVFSVNKIRTHMVREHQKRYKCQRCSETFETAYKRIVHITTVHKEREPINCPLCPNTYYFHSTMKKHVQQVHTREKNISCSLCDWKGSRKHNLNQHIKKSHGNSVENV